MSEAELLSPVEEAQQTMASLGVVLRRLRAERKISITALADEAKLSPGLISQIERGQGNPSFTTLLKLAHVLKSPVTRLMTGPEAADPGQVIRKGAHKRLVMAHENLVYELLTPNLAGALGVVRAQIAAGWDNEETPFVHEGEECVTILTGSLFIVVDGVEYHLEEGDSITLDASKPHWYRNATDEHAILIGAMTPPSF